MSTPMNVTKFDPPSFPKSEETTKFLLDALADNFVFDSIDNSSKLQFVNAMQIKNSMKETGSFVKAMWVITFTSWKRVRLHFM